MFAIFRRRCPSVCLHDCIRSSVRCRSPVCLRFVAKRFDPFLNVRRWHSAERLDGTADGSGGGCGGAGAKFEAVWRTSDAVDWLVFFFISASVRINQLHCRLPEDERRWLRRLFRLCDKCRWREKLPAPAPSRRSIFFFKLDHEDRSV